MGRQGHDAAAAANPGTRMQRSPSRISLSASFEALAVYFPCMNSFDEEDGGKAATAIARDRRGNGRRECWAGSPLVETKARAGLASRGHWRA